MSNDNCIYRKEQLEKAQTADPVSLCFVHKYYSFAYALLRSFDKSNIILSQFSALECFSVGDGLPWEDARFHAASNLLFL